MTEKRRTPKDPELFLLSWVQMRPEYYYMYMYEEGGGEGAYCEL